MAVRAAQIGAAVIFGLLFGLAGVILATPLKTHAAAKRCKPWLASYKKPGTWPGVSANQAEQDNGWGLP